VRKEEAQRRCISQEVRQEGVRARGGARQVQYVGVAARVCHASRPRMLRSTGGFRSAVPGESRRGRFEKQTGESRAIKRYNARWSSSAVVTFTS